MLKLRAPTRWSTVIVNFVPDTPSVSVSFSATYKVSVTVSVTVVPPVLLKVTSFVRICGGLSAALSARNSRGFTTDETSTLPSRSKHISLSRAKAAFTRLFALWIV